MEGVKLVIGDIGQGPESNQVYSKAAALHNPVDSVHQLQLVGVGLGRLQRVNS